METTPVSNQFNCGKWMVAWHGMAWHGGILFNDGVMVLSHHTQLNSTQINSIPHDTYEIE